MTLHVSAHQEHHPQGAQCNPDEVVHMLHHDVEYVQFNQDYIGFPEDAPDAPKHGAR
jgi:hypothetical protein